MAQTNRFESAATEFHTLIRTERVQQIRGSNEAKTRLLLIDEILAILGWPKDEYNPEEATSTGQYTDYRLRIDGDDRLIVEAKKFGLLRPLDKLIQRPDYTNAYLFNHCGDDIESLIQQCRNYCLDCAVSFAVATTGEIWIMMMNLNPNVEWGKMRALVFHSLDDVDTRFGEFYSLLSREAVQQNSLEEKLGSMVVVRPSTAIRPREELDEIAPPGAVEDRRIIQNYFEHFMGDITDPGRERMLRACFVENTRLNEFSGDLRKLLEYNAVLDEQEEDIKTATEDELSNALDNFDPSASKSRVILLVGNIGSGKSTFVHRFMKFHKKSGLGTCVVVDLIDRTAFGTDDKASLSRLALECLARIVDPSINPYILSVIRGCFHQELQRFGERKKQLNIQDKERYLLEEEEFLYKLSDDVYEHLVRFIRYCRTRHVPIWLVLDNVDRGSYAYQRSIYSFAHGVAVDGRCLTLVTLREDTYLLAKETGFLDVRESDTVFRVSAPEFSQVVSKRRKYVEALLQSRALPKNISEHRKLVCAITSHINRLVTMDDGTIRYLISSFSLGDIRFSLRMLKDYYSSFHSTLHEILGALPPVAENESPEVPPLDYSLEYSRLLQSLMLGSGWSYREGTSSIFNVFSVDPLERGSHFLILRMLAYLSLDRNLPNSRAILLYQKLSRDFVFLGYSNHQISNAMRKMLGFRLVLSPSLPATKTGDEPRLEVPDPLPRDMRIAISSKGMYILRRLASDSYYQLRVGEDTVWYNEELAHIYIRCLKDSVKAQTSFGHEDALEATTARDTFLTYLKRSIIDENHHTMSRHTRVEWARTINDLVERSVFGAPLTRSVYAEDPDPEADADQRPPASRRGRRTSFLKQAGLQLQESNNPQQMQLFASAERSNYGSALQQALASLPPLPTGVSIGRSENIVRVLWALEIASRAGIGSQRASEVALIIRDYGKVAVEDTNIAKFFRNQRKSCQFIHLYNEEPVEQYSINPAGEAKLLALFGSRNSA